MKEKKGGGRREAGGGGPRLTCLPRVEGDQGSRARKRDDERKRRRRKKQERRQREAAGAGWLRLAGKLKIDLFLSCALVVASQSVASKQDYSHRDAPAKANGNTAHDGRKVRPEVRQARGRRHRTGQERDRSHCEQKQNGN